MRMFCTLCCLLCISPVFAAEVTVLGLFKDRAVLMIDGNRHVLERGQSSPEGVRLISADSEAAVLEVDGKRARFPLGQHIGASFSTPKAREVHLFPDRSGMYRTTGAINGFPVPFLVDTGATSIAINADQARRLGIDFRIRGQEGRVETASGMARAWRISLDRVRVSDIELRNVPAVVIDGTHPTEALLGMSFLNRLEMQHQGQALMLRQKW